MTDTTGQHTPTHTVDDTPPKKKHHWWRWILAVAVVLILLVVAVGVFSKPQPASPGLVLPTAAAIAPVGPLAGTWTVAAGSTAGFRVRETFLGMSDDSTGRTNAVTGTLAVTGDQVTAATFTVDLTTMQVAGKPQPQFATSLDTPQFPTATFVLAHPVMVGSAFASGATTTAAAPGLLTLHGVSHPASVTISARRDGATLQIAGSIPITFSDWGITGPTGYGVLGSLANNGTAEFLLAANRQ